MHISLRELAAGRGFVFRRLDRLRKAIRFGLRVTFGAVFVVYVAWNGVWFSQGELAPSLLYALTGIPAPTTGCTRSLLALLDGNWLSSIQYNAMTLPICGMLALSVFQLGCQASRGNPMRLSGRLAWGWLAVLLAAWMLKLAVAMPSA